MWEGCDRGAEGEQGGERGQAAGQGGGGDHADEQGAAGVAEFPADLGRAPGPAERAAVAPASGAVGRRNAGADRRRVRSAMVWRSLGSGGAAGTASIAHPATARPSAARTANSRPYPWSATRALPSSGPRV